ncbi:NAD-dependent epimerase/dehydratase family protein [Gordonia soli]|uniref:Putative autoregulator biosynthesis enzyme n=1 Tax=Gordonia soli NBRC 108243 TaxID=1223545 RepID=M0QG75_9ACTN|nr:NAD(P)-dependent oxidoreductase [Gordonia soli]GAC67444.1 putative autoregulator biosynthesis enzyme [Gordonia soli NBRC 108243]
MRLGLTGATGFVGSEVHRQALRRGWEIVALTRSDSHPESVGSTPTTLVRGDLTDPDGCRGVFRDVDAILHCANAIQGEPDHLAAVNITGTQTVIGEFEGSSRVRSLGVISTAAVYDDRSHRQMREVDGIEAPSSTRSHTRLVADRMIRAAGGFALRPHFVVGPGDTHVLPTAAALARHLAPGAVHSFIDVRDLAEFVVQMTARRVGSGRAFHVSGPNPAGWDAVLGAIGVAGPSIRCDDSHVGEPTARQLSLLNVEHTYDDSSARSLTGFVPSRDPSSPDAAYLRWYRSTLPRSVTPTSGS